MAVALNDQERAVLTALVENGEQDPEGAWNPFHHSIIDAADGSLPVADAICRNLRRRKLIDGSGRGKWATYWPNDKGKEAVKS